MEVFVLIDNVYLGSDTICGEHLVDYLQLLLWFRYWCPSWNWAMCDKFASLYLQTISACRPIWRILKVDLAWSNCKWFLFLQKSFRDCPTPKGISGFAKLMNCDSKCNSIWYRFFASFFISFIVKCLESFNFKVNKFIWVCCADNINDPTVFNKGVRLLVPVCIY